MQRPGTREALPPSAHSHEHLLCTDTEQQVSPRPEEADILVGETDRTQSGVDYRLGCEVISVVEEKKAGQGLRSTEGTWLGSCSIKQAIRGGVSFETFEQRPGGGEGGSQVDIQEEARSSAKGRRQAVVINAVVTADSVFLYLVC